MTRNAPCWNIVSLAALTFVCTVHGASARTQEEPPAPAVDETREQDARPWAEQAAGGEALAPTKPIVRVRSGIRRDDLNWSIAGLDGSPNILSELRWTDVTSYELSADFEHELPGGTLVKASLAVGAVFSGDNQDSDYDNDDRRDEFSRSNNDSSGGYVFDFSFNFGRRIRLRDEKSVIVPAVGLSFHRQHFVMTDGFQTISENSLLIPDRIPPPVGPFAGLASTYQADWLGLWLGAELRRELAARREFFVGIELHLADYDGTANWNLRSDFAHPVSFTQDAFGIGVVLKAGFRHEIQERGAFMVELSWQQWETGRGTDLTFFSDDFCIANGYPQGCIGSTLFNGTHWEALRVSVGLEMRF